MDLEFMMLVVDLTSDSRVTWDDDHQVGVTFAGQQHSSHNGNALF